MVTRRDAILMVSASGAALASAARFDADFGTALEAAAAIQARQVSSEELTKHVFRRIDRFEPKLNTFVYELRGEALAAARKIDAAVARREKLPPFAGVPVVVKESFAIAGRPCTWGIPALKDTRAPRNSVAVQRLLDAGAVVVGATNVPFNLSDGQSYNDIYGTTNNPWDLQRTPGGSSGGTAAALAAGLGFLGLGSDIGGSIRAPAHCCGIFGHKPTVDVVSKVGHSPGGRSDSPGASEQLSACGPMARSAEDLEAAMRVLGGPDAPFSMAYRWALPAPRHRRLGDFRIGYVLEDPVMRVSSEVKPALESALRMLEKAGAKLERGWPAGFSFGEFFETYLFMLSAILFSFAPPQEQERQRAEYRRNPDDLFAAGAMADFASWQRMNFRRLGYRAAWQEYFRNHDAFLLPALPVPAFPHDHTPQAARTLATPEGPIHYLKGLLAYMSVAILTGCPATVAPAGRTPGGLPVGIQMVGPFLEDATPIRLAALLAEVNGGFTPPPGYRAG